MKLHSVLTILALSSAVMLPACAHHDKTSEVQVERNVVSGDPATGNYVESVTEKGPGYSKTTTETHSIGTQVVPASSQTHPNSTVHSVKETNVRRMRDANGKIKEEKTATESHSVTPNAGQ